MHYVCMAQTIPPSEPLEFRAGDTVAWTKSLADFSAADGWVLNYRFINAAGKFDITGTASGTIHAINVSAATTGAYAGGVYSWQAYVTKGAERYTIGHGNTTVLSNLAGEVAGYDTRSSARKCLDQLDAALATYGKKAYTQSYSIAGRTMSFQSPGEFLAFRSKVQQEVNRETAATRIRNGLSARNKSTIGF